MHVHFLDPYHGGRSLIHHLDARVKLVLAIAYILAMSLTPPGAWPVYLLLMAIPALSWWPSPSEAGSSRSVCRGWSGLSAS